MLSLPGQTLVAGLSGAQARMDGLRAAGAEVIVCEERDERIDLTGLLAELARRGVNEVLTETGPLLAGSLLNEGLVDEIVLYLAPHLMGDAGRGLFRLPGVSVMADRIGLDLVDVRRVGPDVRVTVAPRL